jgi:carboxylesterase type B
MLHSFVYFFLAATVSSLPLERRTSFPQVTINDGTVKGSSALGVDSFNGIPFAQPPIGELRLKPPQPLNSSYGTISATGVPAACPQFYAQVQSKQLLSDVLGTLLDTPLLQEVTIQNEDCLTLNVQRPSNIDSDVKLPVLFWIFGGGFELGSTQQYDGTSIVQRSIANGEPVVYVAVNYR